ncbi:hypothetical protein TSUD_370790 [Trifolium subterraneum]|uniref:Uncharacterized protein n=1 Tax=Trifolium subterraneum TaxID=3900 RepID=A0A2Z6NKF0_TRISU|nr:hypothetical protein TSUD_370790 [Trifolium subterraneum]
MHQQSHFNHRYKKIKNPPLLQLSLPLFAPAGNIHQNGTSQAGRDIKYGLPRPSVCIPSHIMLCQVRSLELSKQSLVEMELPCAGIALPMLYVHNPAYIEYEHFSRKIPIYSFSAKVVC